MFPPLAQPPAVVLSTPRPAPAPKPAVVIPASACRPPPDFPASILAKLSPEELAVLTARAEINTGARHAIKTACERHGAVVRVKAAPKR